MKIVPFAVIAAFLCACPISLYAVQADIAAPSAPAQAAALGWTWSGMVDYPNQLIANGVGHAGGPGSFGALTFQGSSVDVYCVKGPTVTVDQRAHRTGKVKISLDGQEKDTVLLADRDTNFGVKVFSTSGLSDGIHVLQVEPVGGWAIVDHVDVHAKPSVPSANDAAPVNGAFSDAFDETAVTGWKTYGGDWILYRGKYCIAAGPGYKSLVADLSFSDLVYDADVSVGVGGNIGVVFRVTNPGLGLDAYNGYYAGIDVVHHAVVLGKSNGGYQPLAGKDYPVQPNVEYHMRVIARGDLLTVDIDGQRVLEAVDGSYRSGAIGVRTSDAPAAFDNIKATPITGR